MKKRFEYKESRGLPGGPNQYITHVSGIFSVEGYKSDSPDVNNPYNIIPSGDITMKGVEFPVKGTDNLGNTKVMQPGNDYKFPGDVVFETPLAKFGGGLLTKTMKCKNCNWSWKAADGGNDVSTCHKCGGQALPTAQAGGEYKVESGNTFDGIANKLGIDKQALREANPGINYDKLQIGQTIKYPVQNKVQDSVQEEKVVLKKIEEKAEKKVKEKKSTELNIEGLKKGIAQAESLGGVLMLNPESTATGLYGQRFSELKGKDLYTGTRKEFAEDLEAQNRIFDIRLNTGIDGKRGLIQDAEDLYEEYKPQIEGFDYSKEDLIGLTNFLGRQGTRYFLGYHLRDGKPLHEALPNIYSDSAKQANKTPSEYLKILREYYQTGGELSELEMYKNYINGVYDGTENESKGLKIYDKLNRVYYKEAKGSGTTVPNYIMTQIIRETP